MSLEVRLTNLYVDREITGEAFLQPYKACNRFIHKMLPTDNCLSNTIRLVSQVAISLFLSPLVLIGMIVKCLNVSQVKSYNDKIKEILINREILNDYPHQADTVRLFPIQERNNFDERNAVLSRLDQATEVWERCACNILGYQGDNEVFIQFLERNPRWQIPEGMVRPFAS